MTQQKRRGRPPKVKVEPLADPHGLPDGWTYSHKGVLRYNGDVRAVFNNKEDALVYLEKIGVIKA